MKERRNDNEYLLGQTLKNLMPTLASFSLELMFAFDLQPLSKRLPYSVPISREKNNFTSDLQHNTYSFTPKDTKFKTDQVFYNVFLEILKSFIIPFHHL
jgi:hypothetical protein